jgi:hypothetical protein
VCFKLIDYFQRITTKKNNSFHFCFSNFSYFFLNFFFKYSLFKFSTDKPFVKKARVNAFGYMHGVTNLTCEALAEPSANFTWYRNGKKISGKHYPIHHGQHVSILSVSFLCFWVYRYVCWFLFFL